MTFDTDSLYVNIGGFIDSHLGDMWKPLPDERKIHYIRAISHVIESYVNDRCYRDLQRKTYNSAVTDFRIKFKQEVIAKSGLFVSKKRYSLWHIDEEGAPVDYIKNTGLEIVRSETPEFVRPRLIKIVKAILQGSTKEDLTKLIGTLRGELLHTLPEEIAVNIGVSDPEKYVGRDGRATKGAPWHVKGVINYRMMLKVLKLDNQYQDIMAGSKMKVVYVKKNQYDVEAISFMRWPKEFDKVFTIDRPKLISKYFDEKVDSLLDPMGWKGLVSKEEKANLDLFFGE